MTRVVLGIDASTTAVKAIAWDASGNARCEGRASYALNNPGTDAWEQDAEQWWQASLEALGQCCRGLAQEDEVAALCIAHQRETFVLTDPEGHPLRPALVWMDARGKDGISDARGPLSEDRVHTISGKPPCITPSFYKLHALLAREPSLATRHTRVLDVHAFLAWRLTGAFATSRASADPLGMVDMQARAWSPDLLSALALDESQLPRLLEPGEPIGSVLDEVADAVGLPRGLPVIAGLGDGQAAGLGAGLVAPGRAYLNLGTAIVSGVLSRSYQTSRAFRTLYGGADRTYFLETDLLGGTFTLNWLLDQLLAPEAEAGRKVSLDELEQQANQLSPGADGLMLLPYFAGVMNPYWDDDARGVMMGLSASHGPAHFYRAIVEGLALEHRVHTEGVEAALGWPIEEFIVMGGGSQSELWCQILADVLDRPILRCGTSEATCLGAGMLAAVHAKMHGDLTEAARAMTRTTRRFVPDDDQERYAELLDIYRGVYPAARQTLSALARFRDPAAP